MNISSQLYDFLLGAFSAGELRRFVSLEYPELEGELPVRKMSHAETTLTVVQLLQRRGAVDGALFAALVAERPRYAGQIEAVRRGMAPSEATSAVPEATTVGGRLDVMFVAANPVALPELQLAAEARQIEDNLRGTAGERRMRIRYCWRADADGLMGALFDGVPDVLHFAGHGGKNGTMLLQTVGGAPHPVAPDALAALLGARPRRPRVIVLNACHSVVMARALLPLVDAVIGLRDAVQDAAARRFAVEFYKAVGHGYMLQVAFDAARAALRMNNLGDDELLQLDVRGVDPRTYRLL